MKPKVLVPISTGFEEIETTTIVDVLRRAGVAVTLAGLSNGLIAGRSAIQLQPDQTLDEALQESNWDAVVLPGGQPNANTLANDPRIISLLQQTEQQGKPVAAICAAPAALAKAGLLNHRSATIFPSCKNDIPARSYVEQDVVVSDGVITSRGPATAMAFSLTLVEILCGAEIAAKVSAAVLAS